MTLTSSESGQFSALNRHFGVLVKRIRRHTRCRFEYFKIKTNEGFGVLHIVFQGSFILQRWLSDAWRSIHGAPIVDIRALYGSDRRLARYLVGGYLLKQSFERMSWSWRWVFRGFVHVWLIIKSRHDDLETAVSEWRLLLSRPILSQSLLFGGG